MTEKPTPTPHTLGKVAKFLQHYGDFLAFWSTFDVMIEIVIMRELGTSEEKTSIVCAGLGFGAKVHLASSLLNRRPSDETRRTIALIGEAQRLAERNSFAHGFFLVNPSTEKFKLLRREVKNTYHARVRDLDAVSMSAHTKRLIDKVKEFQEHALISESDYADYVRHIEVHALMLASQGKPLPAPRTSSGSSKKKSRPPRAQR